MVACWSSFGLDVIAIYIMTTVCISFLLKTIIFHYSISDASPWQPAKKKIKMQGCYSNTNHKPPTLTCWSVLENKDLFLSFVLHFCPGCFS